MENIYRPDGCAKVDLTEEIDEGNWHTGQSYEDTPAKQLRCIGCGGTLFDVAQGSYWTGIRCPVCKYEVEIHDG